MAAKRIFVAILFLFAGSIDAEEPWTEPEQPGRHELSGLTVDSEGKPVADVTVVYDRGDIQVRSDANGIFRFTIEGRLVGSLRAVTQDGTRSGYLPYINPEAVDPETGFHLIEISSPEKVRGKVVDGARKPVAGAKVWSLISEGRVGSTPVESDAEGSFVLDHPAAWPLRRILVYSPGFALGFADVTETSADRKNCSFTIVLEEPAVIRLRAVDERMQPLEGVLFSCWDFYDQNSEFFYLPGCEFRRQTTDESGIAVFDWLPRWVGNPVSFFAATGKNQPNLLSQTVNVAVESKPIETTVQFRRGVYVRGTVFLPGGAPAEDWMVQMRIGDDSQRSTRTDRRGRYEFFVEKNLTFSLSVRKNDDEIYAPKAMPLGVAPVRFGLDSGDVGLFGIDFCLEKPVRVYGTVTRNPELDIPGRIHRIQISELSAGKAENDGFRSRDVFSRYVFVSREDGFEFWLPKGEFRIQPIVGNDETLTENAKPLHISDEHEIRFDIENEDAVRHRTVFVQIKTPPGEDFDSADVAVYVVPKPKNGISQFESPTKPQRKDFDLKVPDMEARLFVSTNDKRFGYAVAVPPNQDRLMLPLARTGRLCGKIHDHRDATSPVSGQHVFARPKGCIGFLELPVETDENGTFELEGVIPGVEYELFVRFSPRDWPDRHAWSFVRLATVTLTSGEVRDLGPFQRPRLGGPSEIGWAFRDLYQGHGGNQSLESAWEYLKQKAGSEKKRLMVLFAECGEESPAHRFLFYELGPALYEADVVTPISERFVFMGISIDDRTKDGRNSRVSALDFCRRHGISEEAVEQTTLCIFDYDGRWLHMDTLTEIMEYGPIRSGRPSITHNKPRLIEFLKRWTVQESQ